MYKRQGVKNTVTVDALDLNACVDAVLKLSAMKGVKAIDVYKRQIRDITAGDMGQNKGAKQDARLVFQGFHAVKGGFNLILP